MTIRGVTLAGGKILLFAILVNIIPKFGQASNNEVDCACLAPVSDQSIA